MTNADTWTVETWDSSILCIGRYYDGDKIYGLFNFSEYDKTAWINERDGLYRRPYYRTGDGSCRSKYPGIRILLAEEKIR